MRNLEASRIGLIGAYERDNFGDLLFGIVTSRLLEQWGASSEWLAPFSGTVDHLVGNEVRPYRQILQAGELGGLWTVGGEVGGVTPEACADIYPGIVSRTPREDIATPYLLDTVRYPAQLHVPYVVNSVGLASLARADIVQREADLAALRGADFVSVRDQHSSSLLDSFGVRHSLAPDVVHALPAVVPIRVPHEKHEYMLFQCVSYDLPPERRDLVAEQLVAIARQTGLKLGFFAAGIAPLHDSFDVYEDLARRIRALGNVDTEVIRERDPLKLVEIIAGAKLWVGSSLHGRVLSCTFGVPRVGLSVAKLTAYGELWDPQYPLSVKFEELASRVHEALRIPPSSKRGEQLGRMALDNLEKCVQVLSNTSSPDREERATRRFQSSAVMHRRLLRAASEGHSVAPPPTLSEEFSQWKSGGRRLVRRAAKAGVKRFRRMRTT